jgi:sugar lactone lactonase YvrE
MTIGVAGQPSDTGCTPGNYLSVKWGGAPFNRPTSVALSPDGDIYVTDGYLNARVHRFRPDGKLVQSWGEPGSGPGQFRLPHGICIDRTGTIFVGDRMNSRVQIFSPQGEFIAQWNDVYQPNDLCIDPQGNIVIAEVGYQADLPMSGPTPAPEDSYSRVTIRNSNGEILYKITNEDPTAPGGFLAAHGVRADSRGDMYVTEVPELAAKKRGLDRHKFHLVQKLVRVAD